MKQPKKPYTDDIVVLHHPRGTIHLVFFVHEFFYTDCYELSTFSKGFMFGCRFGLSTTVINTGAVSNYMTLCTYTSPV